MVIQSVLFGSNSKVTLFFVYYTKRQRDDANLSGATLRKFRPSDQRVEGFTSQKLMDLPRLLFLPLASFTVEACYGLQIWPSV